VTHAFTSTTVTQTEGKSSTEINLLWVSPGRAVTLALGCPYSGAVLHRW